MLLWIGIALVVLWVLGFLLFHVLGSLIHLALIVAVVAIVWHFVAGAMRRR